MKVMWIVAMLVPGCALDERPLTIADGVCALPAPDGLLTDFSAAVNGICNAKNCPDDPGKSTVSLGATRLVGLVYPYRSRGIDVIALSVLSTVLPDPNTAALHAVMSSGVPPEGAGPGYDGLALQFVQCIDTTGYAGVSFTIAGDLGECRLRFALEFKERDAGSFQAPCPIDDCDTSIRSTVVPGTTTALFANAGNARTGRALVGMQWEFGVPGDPVSSGCRAEFTIDEVRLVASSP